MEILFFEGRALRREKYFPRRIYRIAVGALFFLQGLCFASWASRIPSIQHVLKLTDAELGLVLFALPAGLMLSLPLSGWLITRIGSRKMVLTALLIYTLFLPGLGLSANIFQLSSVLFLFGLSGNMVNISVNTQAISVEHMYKRPIMASFHGLWSLAGFTGAAIGSFMIANGVLPLYHFIIVALTALSVLVISARYVVKDETPASGSRGLVMPDKSLFHLGFITFCGMICEGAMFDWSGIYFQKVVQPDKEWLGAGYTAVMFTMASGRFIADRFAHRFGLRLTLQMSGGLIAAGLMLSVLYPQLITAVCGFMLVGFGISSIVPLVYSAAGRSKILSPGVALAAVSTIGFFGFLLGPPMIGLIAGLFNLQVSFTVIAFMGLCVIMLSSFIRKTE